MKDLRNYLEFLSKDHSEQIVTISEEISPEFEITSLLFKLADEGLYPALLFTNVKNLRGEKSGMGVAVNLFADRRRLALSLDLLPEECRTEVSRRYLARRENRIKPELISKKEAPVKEFVKWGNADLRALPVVTHHEMDSGPYLTMPVVTKDPDTGAYNASFHRIWVKGPRDTGISLAPRHTWDYYVRYEKKGIPMPVAVVLGHHPGFCLGAMASVPIDADEYEVIGGLLNEPLRLVPSETWGDDFLVPADAEIVVEGEVPPKIREVEGPFGEFTGYYGGQRLNPVIKVKAITHREAPILQTVFAGHRDHDCFLAVAMEGDIFAAVKPVVPSVKAVHIPPSGKGYNCYISLLKRYEGAGKLAATAALPVHDFVKHVIVVDDDIDVFNEKEVLFALATRVQASADLEIIKGIRGNILDPSATRSPLWDNVIIDATRPVSRPFETRVSIPREVYDRIDLTSFIPQERLKALKERR